MHHQSIGRKNDHYMRTSDDDFKLGKKEKAKFTWWNTFSLSLSTVRGYIWHCAFLSNSKNLEKKWIFKITELQTPRGIMFWVIIHLKHQKHFVIIKTLLSDIMNACPPLNICIISSKTGWLWLLQITYKS